MFTSKVLNDEFESDRLIDHLPTAILSILFITICSRATSPFFPEPAGGDSAIFLTIGKYWNAGKVPYVDLWDLKGPLIFLFNAAGYRIMGTRTGVFILQILWMFISLVFINKTLRLYYSKRSSFLFLLLICGAYSFNYQTGNSVEECCMPFLTSSFFLMSKWFKRWNDEQIDDHPYQYTFVYGICFGACFLTRITNAVGLCIACLYISGVLFKNKKPGLVFQNIIAFLIGSTLISLPFIIYFYRHNALQDFWYGTIGYNLEYARNSISIISQEFSANQFIHIYFWLLFPILLGSSSANHIYKGNSKYVFWLLISAVTILYLLMTNGYLHYAAITLPYIPIVLNSLKTYTPKMTSFRTITTLILLVICTGLGSINVLKSYYSYFYIYLNGISEEPNDVAVELCQQIPEEDRDSFIAYNCRDGLYLYLNICPCYRFFTMQDWEVQQGESLRGKMISTFESLEAKWVLLNSNSDEAITDIIKSSYRLVDRAQIPYSSHYYELYCRN